MAHASLQEKRLSQVFFFVYVSSAVDPMSQNELAALLEESRAWNSLWGITGILLYKSGNFMQLLEGAEADVRLLVSRIARDPRHIAMTPLIEGFEQQRHYSDWTMAFPDLDSDEVQALPGYSSFLNTPFTKEVFAPQPWNAQKLLLAFKAFIGEP